MNQLEALRENIVAAFPNVIASIDAPNNPENAWMLDIKSGKRSINVEWLPYRGFGISSRDDIGYGEGADEFLVDFSAARERVREILESKADTAPPESVTLADLRERLKMSQSQLADRLDVSQAVISEIERNAWKSKLSTLQKTVEALGGHLEIRVHVGGNRSLTLSLGSSLARERGDRLLLNYTIRGSRKNSIEGRIRRRSNAGISLETESELPENSPVFMCVKDAATKLPFEMKGKVISRKSLKKKYIYRIEFKASTVNEKRPSSFITARFASSHLA